MDRPPQTSPVPDGSPLETLLRQTFQEETARVTLPADALPRLNARLDAANPPRRWIGPLRLAGAIAVAVLLLALFTPVGRLAAAGVHNAAQTIVSTVKQIASGDGNGDSTPPSGTALPRATNASGSSVAATTGVGSPPTGGAANPTGTTTNGSPAVGTARPVVGTPAGTAIATAAQPSGAAPPVGTQTATAMGAVAATATASSTPATTTPATAIVVITTATTTPTTATVVATATAAPTLAITPVASPTVGGKGSATPTGETVSPAPLPPSLRSGTPAAYPSVTVVPPAPERAESETQDRNDQCKGQKEPSLCRTD